MLKCKLTGDWSKAKSILSKSAQLKAAINDAVMQEAQQARRDIIKGITEQAPGGKAFDPLSPITLALRRARGFRGKKIMIVTAGLRNSIVVKRTGPGKAFVGVLRSARSKDGKLLHNVARIQELGGVIVIRVTPKMKKWLMMQLRKSGIATREKGEGHGSGQLSSGVLIIKIPARPFISPVIEKIQADPKGLQRRLGHRVAKSMNMALGSPTG